MVLKEAQKRVSFRGSSGTLGGVITEAEFTPDCRLKTGHFVLGRIDFLRAGGMPVDAAITAVARELIGDWEGKSLCTKGERTVRNQLKKTHELHLQLKRYQTSKKPPRDLASRIERFKHEMSLGYDIKTQDECRIKAMNSQMGIKTLPPDQQFYEDNCHGERQITHTGLVDEAWAKKMERKKREEERQSAALEKETKRTADNQPRSYDLDLDEAWDDFQNGLEDDDCDYVGAKPEAMAGATSPLEWPQLDTRESRNVLSEVIARVFVQCVSDYRVSVEHLRGIFVSIANAVFGQNWELESFREGEAASSAPRVVKDLTRVFPSGRSMNRWIKAAAILNLQYLGSRIKNQEKDETVTCCHDDTTKAAGHKRFDVKCIEFVFKNPTASSETLSAGLMANASHSGEDSAAAIRKVYQMMAILTGGDSAQELIDITTFFMSDRGGEVNKTHEELNVDSSKWLKCNAHITLAVDEAVDKIFREYEQTLGFSNLLEIQSTRFNGASRGKSVLQLAQIALAKLLSPSHAANSISLYNEFNAFLKDNDSKNSFKGFISNRFGRRGKTACVFLEWSPPPLPLVYPPFPPFIRFPPLPALA